MTHRPNTIALRGADYVGSPPALVARRRDITRGGTQIVTERERTICAGTRLKAPAGRR
jgi:hypothetical protein